MTQLDTYTTLQRNILDIDNLCAYAWRTRKYFNAELRTEYSDANIDTRQGNHTSAAY